MDKIELKAKLDANGINPKEYSLDGTLKPVRTILLFSNSEWSIFDYDERGRISALEKFNNESDACEALFNRLVHYKKFKAKFNLK